MSSDDTVFVSETNEFTTSLQVIMSITTRHKSWIFPPNNDGLITEQLQGRLLAHFHYEGPSIPCIWRPLQSRPILCPHQGESRIEFANRFWYPQSCRESWSWICGSLAPISKWRFLVSLHCRWRSKLRRYTKTKWNKSHLFK